MLFADFSSYVFNLSVFCAVAVGFAVLFLRLKNGFGKPGLYITFLILGIFAVLTQLSYVYAPKRIFSNASHHIIEQIGFSFKKQISLVNSQMPATALWDDKQGELSLTLDNPDAFVLAGRNFYEPVFAGTPDKYYELVNALTEDSLTQMLTIELDDTLSIDLKINPANGSAADETYTFTPKVSGKAFGPFDITQKNLKTGYSLGGLIADSQADFPLLDRLAEYLDQSWLVRKRINPQNALDISEVPLVFFPSKTLLDSACSISVDGKKIRRPENIAFETRLTASAVNRTFFYTGLWTTRTKIYSAVVTDLPEELCVLSPLFSDKKQLKKLEQPQESLFITSSSQEVAENELLSGFYYSIFDLDSNTNHFAATIAYNEGNTRQRMKFRLTVADQNDLENVDHRLFNAGDTIRVETAGAASGVTGNVALFRITDLKASNALQFWHMALFTVLLVISIFISLLLSPEGSFTKTEVITYLLLLVLMTIRSVLLWRVSTFPPLEDISSHVYGNMVNVGFAQFSNGAIGLAVFFILLWMWKLFGAQIKEGRFSMSLPFEVPWMKALINFIQKKDFGVKISVLVIALYGFSAASSIVPKLDRFSAVFFPLVSFFIIELVLLKYARKRDRATIGFANFRTLSIVNWLICFAYLALSDAGFSIVFTMSSLLYWLLRLLTFPDHQLFRPGGFRFRGLRFIIPFLLLLFILLGSPWLLSVLFQHVRVVLTITAGLLAVLGAYLALRKVVLWENKLLVTYIAAGILIAAAALLAVWPDLLVKKIEDKTYIRYRAEVLFKTPDEIIRDEDFRFNLGNDSKLLRAAQNQWIINHYYSKGHWGLYDYFRLLPSFQKGSPYMTQISDLVTVRYLIGEHSQAVVLSLLLLMAILVISTTDNDTRFNIYSKMRAQLLCIFFTVGFFIWMAATNRMVFLGQDFPLLSVNSKLTLFFSLTILFSGILLGYLAKEDRRPALRFNDEGRKVGYRSFRLLITIGTLLTFVRQGDFDTRRFDLDTTATQLQSAFLPINDLFAYFQQRQKDTSRTRDPQIAGLIEGFDQFIRHDKDSLFKSNFARSAYEAYRTRLSKQNSSDNLIHLKRGPDSVYVFAVNKLFYNVYSPDIYEQAWRGNVLAADDARSFTLVNRDNKSSHILDADRFDSDFGYTISASRLFEINQNQNLRLSVVPAGWLPDTMPAIIVSRTSGTLKENRSDFVIKKGVEILRSGELAQATILRPDDILQFIPDGKSQPVNLQYKHKSNAYLAKNVWLNGRRQFFYPLRDKFLWSYYFTNLVKNKYDSDEESQMLNVQSTIDGEVTSKVRTLAENYFKSEEIRLRKMKDRGEEAKASDNARAFNLVVLDNDGKIRALTDYKNGDKIRLDPNEMLDFITGQQTASLQLDVNRDRLTFGNRCLMRMDNGPASTFKPIMYGAVTSQYNFGWPELRFGKYNATEPRSAAGDYVIQHFAGVKGLTFVVPDYNTEDHGIREYISKSTNTYNSLIVFLGSLNRREINGVHDYLTRTASDITFLSRGAPGKPANTFPVLRYGNDHYFIEKFPNWKKDNSIMSIGLWENFEMPTRNEHLRGPAGQHLQNIAWNLDSDRFDQSASTYKLWSFPEPSHAFMIDRVNLHSAIVQLSTGASPIYATPLKMAEMAGKLFSFNKDFKATVVEGAAGKFTPLTADATWKNESELSAFYSQNLFSAMHATITAGTATRLIGSYLTSTFKDYHFYAKTGTISGDRHKGRRDKHLMLIISKKPVHDQRLTPEDLKNNKFYVLYFSMYKQSSDQAEWGNEAAILLRNAVAAVIHSSGFQTHMK